MHAIVVGGGIVGIASAYYLQRNGVETTVLEKTHVGAGSTGWGGGIRTQFSTPENVRLSLASREVWDGFEAEFGVDPHRRELGYLLLAREPDTAEQLRADVEMQQELGAPNESLSAARARRHCPGLAADRFVGAGYSPDDSFVDANLALQGFADRARESGVTIHTGTEVTSVIRADSDDSGRVIGVETADGDTIASDVVVNAAGPWAGEVAELAGVDLPIAPQLRRQLLVDPEEALPAEHPLTMDLDSGFVFYPERSGEVIVSGQVGEMRSVDPDSHGTHVDMEWIRTVLEGVGEMASYFGPDTEVRDRIAGVYATTPDRNPIVEETVPGLVNAVGFSGHGFMHAPATGQLVADIVAGADPGTVDLDRFASDRFARRDENEQNFI